MSKRQLAILPIAAIVALFVLYSTAGSKAPEAGKGSRPMTTPKKSLVFVKVFNSDGKLTEPVVVPKVIRTDLEWRTLLTQEQYTIMRSQGTEPAFCGGLLKNKEAGAYLCMGCNLPLFSSDAKFESGTGWPSFFQPIASENVIEKPDHAHGMVRTEILCARCDSHLGHVFDDGPRPTGMRFCLNSAVLKFVPTDKLKTVAEKVEKIEVAEMVIAGGCFWCVEGVFEELDGVVEAISGYAGGDAKSANYEAVSSGQTPHAEAVKIIYDPKKLSYEQLLKVHFETHDPTTKDRQGNDVGPQYRSAIFYANETEKKLAEAFIADVTDAKAFKKPIVTTLEPLKGFYAAEIYHQNFVCRNPNQGYVRAIALPKVQKVREKFSDLVSPAGK